MIRYYPLGAQIKTSSWRCKMWKPILMSATTSSTMNFVFVAGRGRGDSCPPPCLFFSEVMSHRASFSEIPSPWNRASELSGMCFLPVRDLLKEPVCKCLARVCTEPDFNGKLCQRWWESPSSILCLSVCLWARIWFKLKALLFKSFMPSPPSCWDEERGREDA